MPLSGESRPITVYGYHACFSRSPIRHQQLNAWFGNKPRSAEARTVDYYSGTHPVRVGPFTPTLLLQVAASTASLACIPSARTTGEEPTSLYSYEPLDGIEAGYIECGAAATRLGYHTQARCPHMAQG